jgi:hypothetical protein
VAVIVLGRWAQGQQAVERLLADRHLQQVVADGDTVAALLRAAARHVTTAVSAVEDDPDGAPRHASWLNNIEIWFSVLTRKVPRRGEFASCQALAEKIIEFIGEYNAKARPFRWSYDGRPLKAA